MGLGMVAKVCPTVKCRSTDSLAPGSAGTLRLGGQKRHPSNHSSEALPVSPAAQNKRSQVIASSPAYSASYGGPWGKHSLLPTRAAPTLVGTIEQKAGLRTGRGSGLGQAATWPAALPGHTVVQAVFWKAWPSQKAPPLSGVGLVQVRVRFCQPRPQRLEQGDHSAQLDQPPFTAGAVGATQLAWLCSPRAPPNSTPDP